jgi:hypothetical protein
VEVLLRLLTYRADLVLLYLCLRIIAESSTVASTLHKSKSDERLARRYTIRAIYSTQMLRLVGRSVRREQWWGNPECQQRVIEVYPYDEGRTMEPR